MVSQAALSTRNQRRAVVRSLCVESTHLPIVFRTAERKEIPCSIIPIHARRYPCVPRAPGLQSVGSIGQDTSRH
jgi:hypothetical protein